MFDEKDLQILKILERDSKIGTVRLAGQVGIPPTTAHNRIKRMEKSGIIKGYRAVVDYEKLGRDVVAFALVSVNYYPPSGNTVSQEELARTISGFPEVEERSI